MGRVRPARSVRRYTAAMSSWFVYLIECRDGSLYTGIATDPAARYAVHVAGKGARYTRSHPPVKLLMTEPHPDRSSEQILGSTDGKLIFESMVNALALKA